MKTVQSVGDDVRVDGDISGAIRQLALEILRGRGPLEPLPHADDSRSDESIATAAVRLIDRYASRHVVLIKALHKIQRHDGGTVPDAKSRIGVADRQFLGGTGKIAWEIEDRRKEKGLFQELAC